MSKVLPLLRVQQFGKPSIRMQLARRLKYRRIVPHVIDPALLDATIKDFALWGNSSYVGRSPLLSYGIRIDLSSLPSEDYAQ